MQHLLTECAVHTDIIHDIGAVCAQATSAPAQALGSSQLTIAFTSSVDKAELSGISVYQATVTSPSLAPVPAPGAHGLL